MTAPYNTYTQQDGTGSQTQFTTGFDAQILDTDVKVYLLDANGTYVEQATSTYTICLLYTSPSPRDRQKSRMPSSA